jgi:hypothetical protein
MRLELKDGKGLIGTIELPVAEIIKEVQDLGNALVASPAQHDTGAG